MREISRQINSHQTVVAAAPDPEAPPGDGRSLQRHVSDGGADPDAIEERRKERLEAWRAVRETSRKHAHLGHCSMATSKELQTYYEASPIFRFQGRPGEQHRVFIFSAELSAEAEHSPWAAPAELAPHAEACFDFLKKQLAPSDVVMLCDGRSIMCRRSCENATKDMRNVHEAWVVYKPTKRLGRRVAFGADNREAIIVSMPVPRTRMTATPRSEFSCAGEESTHETTYTGVPTAP